jgi:hypothetical protein
MTVEAKRVRAAHSHGAGPKPANVLRYELICDAAASKPERKASLLGRFPRQTNIWDACS